MRKILSIAIAIIMVLSMAACGSKTEAPAQTDPKTEAPAQTEPQKPAETEPAKPAETPAEKPQQSGSQTNVQPSEKPGETEVQKPAETQPESENGYTGHLHMIRGTYRDMASDEFNGNWYNLAGYRFDKLWLDDDQSAVYPKLQEALMKYDDDTRDYCYARLEEMSDSAREMIKEGRNPDDYPSLTWEVTDYVTRADNKFFSFVEQTYCYLGGAHPDTFYLCYNYYPETGEEIEFTDLVTDVDAFRDLVTAKLKEDYDYVFEDYSESGMKDLLADWFSYADYEDGDGKKTKQWKPQWFVGNEALTVIFNEYDIAPYAAGTLTVNVPYRAYPELFNMELVEPAPDYVTPLIWWWGENYDLGHDGTFDEVGITCDIDYDEMMEEDYIVGIGVATEGGKAYVEEEIWYADATAYIVHTADGCDMAFIYCDSMWGGETQIFDITNDVAYAGTVSGWLEREILTDPSYVPVSKSCNVAGTFSGAKTYKFGELGSFYSDDPYYTLYTDLVIETIDVLELPLCVDPAEGKLGETRTLPAGSRLLPVRTNDYDWIDLKDLKTGEEVRMTVVSGDYESYQALPDGRTLNQIFDIVYWAG
ncbi:MAG: DUF3298 domain-containing protein [Firmicutes bacterium]|nr:DUF3298 domain-containing protein [Bacillota bacterium]